MSGLGGLFDNIVLGLQTALSLSNLFYCLLGVFLGTVLGVLPGIGALISMSLLFPITFHMEPMAALVMLAGIFYGTTYGGSTSAILLNVPGTPNSAVACLDGYPMARQGRAGFALLATTIASFVGGTIGIVLIMFFSPVIAEMAVRFGAAEYFALMVLGLLAAATISTGSMVKGIAMVLVGVLLGLVRADTYTGIPRFSFGILELHDGISLVALTVGLFGVSEVIAGIRAIKGTGENFDRRTITMRSMIPTRDEARRSWLPMLRGSGVGAFFGTLPGAGGLIAAFMAYAVEKRVASQPDRFGKGAVEGLVAPEAANNAADQTAFIPTMTLGIPGSPAMAIILGVLMVHSITPGPMLLVNEPTLFWGLIMSFWVGNLMLLVLNIPLIGLWIRLLTVPYHLLYPAILMFVCVGVYSVNNSSLDIWVIVLFGVLGYLMRLADYPAAPLILGFVLGPMMEENFRRAMLLGRGDPLVFFQRPISGTIMALSLILLVWVIWSAFGNRRAGGGGRSRG